MPLCNGTVPIAVKVRTGVLYARRDGFVSDGAQGGAVVNWHVYIILCTDDTLYTGITTDIERRLRQHATGRGAKYFRGRKPKELFYLEGGFDRSTASSRERAIKELKRADKKLLAASPANMAKGEGCSCQPFPCPYLA